jgi:ubiquinone/menaquinone biosynthesis C-methylase UbiE
MSSYYSQKLSAERLRQVYDVAPPRVQQYLRAELEHVLKYISPGDMVLDLGCGYGRIIPQLAEKAGWVVGIDSSVESLSYGREYLGQGQALPLHHHFSLVAMDAVRLGFTDRVFDRVVCIQNGISAFKVNQRELIAESIRVVKRGGAALFSSYSDKFWADRLEWFQAQAEAGLLGEIDEEKTGEGVIVCQDGFRATTVRPEDFLKITAEFPVKAQIVEVDSSSIFCEINLN